MAKLAILGHATRGKDIIEILEMLGGYNLLRCEGNNTHAVYYVDKFFDNFITCSHACEDSIIFTINEFLENFPYKVWDKVLINDDDSNVYMVKSMVWNEDFNRVVYKIEAVDGTIDKHECFAHEMVLFNRKKEEDTEERKYADLRLGLDQDDKLATEATEATIDGDKITPPNNYLIGKITKVDNGMLVEFVKEQPQYPMTYDECCAIIGGVYSYTLKWNNPFCINRDTHPHIKHLDNLIESFCKLLVCRYAYWKIAGEQMGLRKPWEPEFRFGKKKYCIMTKDNKVIKATVEETNRLLAFPTQKMRDAFFEYFKDLIKECKELL